ncbi:amylo-alpha-1,6-glucosidase [Leptolyngbya sp. FACHB-261]|uniref:amylo-alpha-1,6-glucosidase n=1 Tax=Leptolyngbya sp. FACHB-261 TaxID=2692806 RepID=UPI001685ADFB|nr:amylo-alpha-1,6-glucosidase [Leptolyngbya sp. FACHB-261]MBD2102779.1 amylo-alpha-1,6-glucosidase [Leptolyngbya sp. FACHB-261]
MSPKPNAKPSATDHHNSPDQPISEVATTTRVRPRYVPQDGLPLNSWPCILTQVDQPTLTLKDQDIFLVTDLMGNIARCGEETSLGLFCQDTRYLSRLELQVDGRAPILLDSDAGDGSFLSALCTNPRISRGEDREDLLPERVGIQREIALCGGMLEQITVTNYHREPVTLTFSLTFEADFADLFEVRGMTRLQRGQSMRPETELDHHILLAYEGLDQRLLLSEVTFSDHLPDRIEGNTAVWTLDLDSHDQKILSYRVEMLIDDKPASVVKAPPTLAQAQATTKAEREGWRSQITHVRSDSQGFNRVIERAEADLYLLRQPVSQHTVFAAGVPWFSTLFGRDSLITANQALVLDPTVARDTLLVLAEFQGTKDDEWRDEQPGKILHEIRTGEMARCNEIPHTPYYGTIDATPLWLMLLGDYYAWTGDRVTVEKLWPNALAAMGWIDRNCPRNGYLAYQRRSARGLVNQGWKDSGDCIVDRTGQFAEAPIALCEVQGYVYSSKVRAADLAHMLGYPGLARQWKEDAQALKVRFNRDFWVSELDYCALALDGDGKPVDSITSNPAHALFTGIFSDEHARSVAERVLAPDLNSGWGIRTLSSDSPAYNPMGYHTGSVWPHDNGMIIQSLRAVGMIKPALDLTTHLFEAARTQPYSRLPELFCGYPHTERNQVIPYPVACSPQAWAAGSVFQLLQAVVNLVPDAPNNYLRVIDPMLPEAIETLSFRNLRVGSTVLDLEFERSNGTTSCRAVNKRGHLRVLIEA